MDLFETVDASLQIIEAQNGDSPETSKEDQSKPVDESLTGLVNLEAALQQLILDPVFEAVTPEAQFPRIYHPDTSFIDPFFEEIEEEIEDDYELPEISQDLYKDFSFKKFIDVQEEVDELRVKSYLEMCRILDTPPISSVIHSLEEETLNLKHRRIDALAMRALVEVLSPNTTIKNLDLSHVILEPRAAYFLGEILISNNNIEDLNLSWCRLGPEEIEQMKTGLMESFVRKFDLSHNSLGDDGMEHLAKVLSQESSIRNLILRRNGLSGESAKLLAESLQIDSRMEHLNLSGNDLSSGDGMRALLEVVAVHPGLTSLDLSWTGLGGDVAGRALRGLLTNNAVLTSLDISNNLLTSEEMKMICEGLANNVALETLNIGHNRLTSDDYKLLLRAASTSAVQILDMGNAWVDKEFLQMQDELLEKRQVTVKFGGVSGNYVIHGPDIKKLHLASAKYEAQAPKNVRQRRDFGIFLLQIKDDSMQKADFVQLVKKEKIKIEDSLVEALMHAFVGPTVEVVDTAAMKELYLKMHPDTKLPEPKSPAQVKRPARKRRPARKKN